MNKAVFFDRDGIINKKAPEHDYIKNWDEFAIIPEIINVMKHVQSKGYKIIIVTNQRGIARGLMTINDLSNIHNNLKEKLSKHGVIITDIFFCPHGYNDDCKCRKPKPGMLIEAKKLYEIDFKKSFLVGDSNSDIIAANSVNMKSILYTQKPDFKNNNEYPSYVISTLRAIIKIIK